jgi:phage repressor protein C with HTH and peptisase S24 domain
MLREPETPFYSFKEKGETPVCSTIQLADGSFPEVTRQSFPSEFLPEGAKVFRVLESVMAPVLNKGALVAVLPGAPAGEGDIVAVFFGRELCFRRLQLAEGGWQLSSQRGQAQDERFIPDAEWPIYYYGKAVWAFQPL